MSLDDLNLAVDLNILLSFVGGLRLFSPMISRFQRIRYFSQAGPWHTLKRVSYGDWKILTLSVMMFIFFWSNESNPIFFTLSIMMLIFFGSDESNPIDSVANWVESIQMWWSQVLAKCLFVLLMVKHETHTPPRSHPAPCSNDRTKVTLFDGANQIQARTLHTPRFFADWSTHFLIIWIIIRWWRRQEMWNWFVRTIRDCMFRTDCKPGCLDIFGEYVSQDPRRVNIICRHTIVTLKKRWSRMD